MTDKAVILLNWNGFQDTSECVDSILMNDPEWKIYIVDNASADKEAEKLQSKFPEVIVLAQNENLGFCEGNNVGVRRAIADGASYITILNNDTLIPEQALTKLLSIFTQLSDAGAISPVILEHPQINKVWFAEARWNASKAQFSLNPENKNYSDLLDREKWVSEFACGCCLLSSARVFNEVGLLDDRYFAYYDEAEWCKRLERKGYLSYVTSKSFIYHKVSKTTPGLVSTYLLARNRLLWMRENLPASLRAKSKQYLRKEFFWHFFNKWGLIKGSYSKKYSAALLQGIKDFRKAKFGKWSAEAGKILFEKK